MHLGFLFFMNNEAGGHVCVGLRGSACGLRVQAPNVTKVIYKN